jgi:hypothetical protein
MVKKCFCLVLFFTLFVPLLSSTLYADSCNTCYSQHQAICEKRCERVPLENRERCYKPCLLRHCENLCGYQDPSNSAHSPSSNVVDCDYCQRRASQNCSKKCEGKSPSCSKICISNSCRAHCGLPAPPSEVLQKNQTSEKKCSACKMQMEHGCKSSCGSGPGSLSCAIACVERKCSQECLID